MGAWGVEPFENDAAADFLNSFRGMTLVQAQERLENALQTPDNYFELDAGDEQVAAIAVIAAIFSWQKTGELLPELLEPLNWTTQLSSETLIHWRTLSLTALEKLSQDDNELLELWTESGEGDAWLAELVKLRMMLDK